MPDPIRVLLVLRRTVEPQWKLQPVLALNDKRFAFALLLGARTSAHFSALR
jgi:hypothetical protein